MDKIRITKKFTFETAHALFGYDGKCSNFHGHSYKLYVTIIGTPIVEKSDPKYGMVMDFTDLKAIVKPNIEDVFDHATLLNKNTPHQKLAEILIENGHKILLVDYQPSTEMMLIDFAKKIKPLLPDHITLHSLKLQETENSHAEWFASDQ